MSAVKEVWLACDICGVADRGGGQIPAVTVTEARATTSFVRRGGRDLCEVCAGVRR